MQAFVFVFMRMLPIDSQHSLCSGSVWLGRSQLIQPWLAAQPLLKIFYTLAVGTAPPSGTPSRCPHDLLTALQSSLASFLDFVGLLIVTFPIERFDLQPE
jgi:hypothetical protein